MRDEKLKTLAEAASLIRDGTSLGIASPAVSADALVPMALIHEIIRQGKRRLVLRTAMASLEADLLIGGGCLSEIHFFGFSVFGTGVGPCYRRASAEGTVRTREESEFTAWLGVLAGSLGIDFIPLPGYQNDMARERSEWPTFPSPLDGKELVAISAIVPDVAVLHVPRADAYGNVQLGDTNRGNVAAEFTATRMMQAAKHGIVTAEEIVPTDEIRRSQQGADLLYNEVDAVVHVPRGAHPYGVADCYAADSRHIKTYLEAAQSSDTFRKYLQHHILEPSGHREYLDRVGQV